MTDFEACLHRGGSILIEGTLGERRLLARRARMCYDEISPAESGGNARRLLNMGRNADV